jgi:bifunctional DNA-binding transcriptional regulator/antitoxin component of YhaV-PrlF toxin-antitoxin module
MVTFEKTAKISSKGQITLPQAIRDVLKSDTVRIILEGDVIRIEPVKELAGSLKQYAEVYVPHESAREQAWSEAVREKHPRR